jgi:hypothetical protein
MKIPIAASFKERCTCLKNSARAVAPRFFSTASDSAAERPLVNTNHGNTRSATVSPFHLL